MKNLNKFDMVVEQVLNNGVPKTKKIDQIKYKGVYMLYKEQPLISKLSTKDLKEATKGLKIINDDELLTVWDYENFQIYGIKD